ncbi:MAG TPA: undecaprenyl-diphosphate phosphatase [Bacteroidales bacterium]|nr:undecaprenyl-diphosphate phosphatase [Bacteroidales bacterium]
MSLLQAIILAIVEGITEFLPVSSTGHMALVASFMNIEKDSFTKLFIENIQFGAIISVLLIYWRKFIDFKSYRFYLKLLIAFIPSAIVGLLIKKHVDNVLEKPMFIAIVMFFGGILLIFVDQWFKGSTLEKEEQITYKKSLVIGCFQLLAIVLPGFSRSAATIIGGMQQKLTRKLAAEFSFFLAVPTLAGAFAKSLWDAYKETPEVLNQHNILMLVTGNVVAFIVAIIAIKAFIAYLTKHGFRVFGYYRILVGLVIILLLIFGKGFTVL